MGMPTEEQTYRAGIVESLNRIEEKVTYTNGKVRKIIIALFLLGGVILGQATNGLPEVVKILIHSLGA